MAGTAACSDERCRRERFPHLQAVLQVGVAHPEPAEALIEPRVELVDDHKGNPRAENDAEAALRVRGALHDGGEGVSGA